MYPLNIGKVQITAHETETPDQSVKTGKRRNPVLIHSNA